MELELLKSGMLYIAAEPLRRPLPVTHSAANDGNDTVKVNKSIKMYEYTFSFYHIISHRDISSGTLATSASTLSPQRLHSLHCSGELSSTSKPNVELALTYLPVIPNPTL